MSYTRVDQGWAEWIAWQLEAAGYRVLMQAWDMVPGTNWSSMMHFALQHAERIIAVISTAYLGSAFGHAEWVTAWRDDPQGTHRKLVPIRVEDCRLPGLLGGITSFDVFGLPADAARKLLIDKIGQVRDGRGKPAVPPPFPDTGTVRGRVSPPDFPGEPPFTDSPDGEGQLMSRLVEALAGRLRKAVVEERWASGGVDSWDDERFVGFAAEVETSGPRRGRLWERGRARPGAHLPRRERNLTRALASSAAGLVLLEGEPGAGKSLALRTAALRSYKTWRAGARSGPLPLYVNLRELERGDSAIDDALILDHVRNSLTFPGQEELTRFAARILDDGLPEGRWLFLFDSFDETPEVIGAVDSGGAAGPADVVR